MKHTHNTERYSQAYTPNLRPNVELYMGLSSSLKMTGTMFLVSCQRTYHNVNS